MFPFSLLCSSFLLSLSTFSLVLDNYLLQRKRKKKGDGEIGGVAEVSVCQHSVSKKETECVWKGVSSSVAAHHRQNQMTVLSPSVILHLLSRYLASSLAWWKATPRLNRTRPFESSKNCVLNPLANQKVQLCCLTKNKHQKTPMELNFGRLSWASVWFWQPVEGSLPNPTKKKI